MHNHQSKFIFFDSSDDDVKEIFNEKPVLIVNEIGINEEVSYNSVGMIKWEDIQKFSRVSIIKNEFNSKLFKEIDSETKEINYLSHIFCKPNYTQKSLFPKDKNLTFEVQLFL